MQSIYDVDTLYDITRRIGALTPSSQRQWGKMTVAQMLAHCAVPIEIALGERQSKRTLMAVIIGRLAKGAVTNEKPFKHGLPTNPDFLVTDQRDFSFEKQRLIAALGRLQQAGHDVMHNRRHPFFGTLTSVEWSNSFVKHMDHHLRQFGV